MLANTSNNTVYADAEGNIAYWHGNFIPKRDTKYDWSKPVDGTTSATEWKGLHTVNESVIFIIHQMAGYKIAIPRRLPLQEITARKKKIILLIWRLMEKIFVASMQ